MNNREVTNDTSSHTKSLNARKLNSFQGGQHVRTITLQGG